MQTTRVRRLISRLPRSSILLVWMRRRRGLVKSNTVSFPPALHDYSTAAHQGNLYGSLAPVDGPINAILAEILLKGKEVDVAIECWRGGGCMNTKNHIFTVDSHVMGEPLRVITGGVPFLKGKSIADKMKYFEENLDHLRSAIILEPRGHDDMFGAVLCEPAHPDADIGIFFMHSGGYLNMCGHGTIGAVTTMLDMGIIDRELEKDMEIILETPAGLVSASPEIDHGEVIGVTFENVSSFVMRTGVEVTHPDLGKITVDIAYGGNIFGIVPASELNTTIEKSNLHNLIADGMKLRKTLNDMLEISHPHHEQINQVDLIIIYESDSSTNQKNKNCVVFGNGQVDRSPCGSGTSAMLALKYQNNEIEVDEEFYNQSILGTTFIGKVVGETKVGQMDAVVPRVKGRAYITGIHHFIIDDRDPLREGISLKNYI